MVKGRASYPLLDGCAKNAGASERMNDEDFERIFQNFDFIDGDYNVLIFDNDTVVVKSYRAFGEFKTDFDIAQLPCKPKDILNLPIEGLITEDGVLVKVTDPSVCEKIANMLRVGTLYEVDEEEEEAEEEGQERKTTSIKLDPKLWKAAKIEAVRRGIALSDLVEKVLRAVLKDEEQPPEVKELLEAGLVKEEKNRSTKDRKPCVDGWEVQCHRGKTPMYSKVVKEVAELIGSEGMEVSIDKITDIVFAAYAGEITRVTAKSHAYRYREVCLEDIGPLKLTRGVKAGLTRLGYSSEKAIYKEVVDAITEHPERMVELIATIERVQKSTARIYVSKYKKWISGHKQDSVEEAVPQSEESITDLDARESITLCYNPEAKRPELDVHNPEEVKGGGREQLKEAVKASPEGKWRPIAHNDGMPIYDVILTAILKANITSFPGIEDLIKKAYGFSLSGAQAKMRAAAYNSYIKSFDLNKIKQIYDSLPTEFGANDIRRTVPVHVMQTEKRKEMAVFHKIVFIARFGCIESEEGAFTKGVH